MSEDGQARRKVLVRVRRTGDPYDDRDDIDVDVEAAGHWDSRFWRDNLSELIR